MLTNRDLVELTAFRRELHRFPEVSGEEKETARRITTALTALAPSRILTGLGGHGVAAVFDKRQGWANRAVPRRTGCPADPRGKRDRMALDGRGQKPCLRP
jgi:hypothetical protein